MPLLEALEKGVLEGEAPKELVHEEDSDCVIVCDGVGDWVGDGVIVCDEVGVRDGVGRTETDGEAEEEAIGLTHVAGILLVPLVSGVPAQEELL